MEEHKQPMPSMQAICRPWRRRLTTNKMKEASTGVSVYPWHTIIVQNWKKSNLAGHSAVYILRHGPISAPFTSSTFMCTHMRTRR